jgi:hypothetical protein
MLLMKIILLIFLAVVSEVPFYGQQTSKKHVITGYVVDVDQYPVAGAIIIINNEKTGVVTDIKGYYKVRANTYAESIGVISVKNGIIQEAINGRRRINFAFRTSNPPVPDQYLIKKLSQDEEEINIGYGTVKRKNLTTSVSKIDGSDQRFASYNSIYDMLQGSVPGVSVNKGSVRIRGISSFRLSNEPLFVVDGIPVSSIADIPPQMVKSIEVLKGSAGAIYGSRGSNGAILIDLKGAPLKDPLPVTIPGKMPFATTQPATNIQVNSATLNGTVSANNLPTSVTFEYGTTPGYGSAIAADQSPVAGNASESVTGRISGLKTGITYHYRVVATNSLGTTIGIDIPFTVPGEVPLTETHEATKTSPRTAQLNGTVNAGHLPTVVTFEYGTSLNYGASIAAAQSPVAGNTSALVSAYVTDLIAGTTYHYRIVATNDQGTKYGDDRTFTSEYVLGDHMNGGYIFYVDETGEHGLVCASADQNLSALWGNCTPEGAAGKAVGTGSKNTTDIILGCHSEGIAARLCYDLELDGYNDWFLPSIDELFLMYENLHEKGSGGFEDSYYWSSTQDRHGAWVVSFFYGSKSNHSRIENAIRTRAVRAF